MNELNQKVIDEMIKAQRLVRDILTFRVKNNILTPTQFQALIFLKNKKNAQMKDIADYFSVTMPTATALIDKLIRESFVLKVNNPKDRRVVKINLSRLGDKLLKDALKQKSEKSGKLLSNLDFNERSTLFNLLVKLS